MKFLLFRFVPLALVLGAGNTFAQAPAGPAADYPRETYAALGSNFAQSIRVADLGWTEAQLEAFLEGFRAAHRRQPYPFDARAEQLHQIVGQRLQALAAAEQQARLKQPGEMERFVKAVAQQLKFEITESGMAYGTLGASGNRPAYEDTVVISYRVVGPDMQTDIPQLERKEVQVKVEELVPGLAEAVQMLNVGGKGMFVMPPELTYGEGTWPEGVASGIPLVYSVTLHRIVPATGP